MTRVLTVLLCLLTANTAAALPPECVPYLLCPYPGGAGGGGSAGTGGRSGSGASGTGGHAAVGGTGGRSGSGGAGGSFPAGGLVVLEPLALDRKVITAGATLHGTITLGNTGNAPVTLRELRIAARAPGATHEGGPYTDLTPALTNVALAPNETLSLNAQRAFTSADTPGQWESYATYQAADGKWHDQPSEYFAVVVKSAPTPPTTGFSVGTQEWYIASWAGTNIYKSGINWATAYSSGADIWNPQFMTELSGYSVFRHMDMNATNFSKISSWSQRKAVTDPKNAEIYIDGGSPSNTTGLAIEWQIDLCNRGNVDCWFTHPYLADDDYLRSEAELIQAKLKPALKLYIELSNEVWNGSFSAYNQAISAGKAMGVPGSNDYYKGISHEMLRALQMYSIYQEVFGAAAMGTRVIRVFAESGNLDLTTQALANVYVSDQWNPEHQKIDMIALAPYIGNGTSGASETLARWNQEVDSKVSGQPIQYAIDHHTGPYNIPLLGCYEGGMHHLQSADAWAKNPASADGYKYMLDRFSTKMNAVCNLYTLHGTWKSDGSGAWGAYDHVGQSLSEAHKARGTREWIAAHAPSVLSTRTVALGALLVIFALVMLWLALRSYRLQGREPKPEPSKHDDKA